MRASLLGDALRWTGSACDGGDLDDVDEYDYED
jgi:hypothetical protein